MAEVKYHGKTPEQRIHDRLKPSDEGGDVHVVKGTGPNRTHTFVRHSGNVHGSTTKQKNKEGK